MRLIFDCNVLISAALSSDPTSARALDLAIEKSVLLSSLSTEQELEITLKKPKLSKYLRTKDRITFLKQFRTHSIQTPITIKITACRDPKDDMYLELAISGKADAIITGDKDLLDLHPF
ncbi:MAG: putative toxin-antitoxin system toxin component, PIN family [Marinoscillum sp.]